MTQKTTEEILETIDETANPADLTDEQKEAMRAAFPEAYGDPEGGEEELSDADKAALDPEAGKETKPADPPLVDDPAKPAGETKAGETPPVVDDKKKSAVVPIARLNEVLQREGKKDEALANKDRELAELRDQLAKAQPPEDFAAARAALNTQYDDGDITLTEFMDARDKITLAESEHRTRIAVLQDREKSIVESAEREWNSAITAFNQEHAEFLKEPAHVNAMNRALAAVETLFDNLSNDELIRKAARMAYEMTGKAAPEPVKEDPKPQNPADARRLQNVKRIGEANSIPALATVGVGDRQHVGEPAVPEDAKDWRNMPSAEKERILGGKGAL